MKSMQDIQLLDLFLENQRKPDIKLYHLSAICAKPHDGLVENCCRPSRRGVSRNGVLAEKFHILTSTGALNLQLFDCKYEDVRKAAVLQMLEAIFAKH